MCGVIPQDSWGGGNTSTRGKTSYYIGHGSVLVDNPNHSFLEGPQKLGSSDMDT